MADVDPLDFDEEDSSYFSDEEEGVPDFDPVNADDDNSIGLSRKKFIAWINLRRGWILMIGLALIQAIFVTILLHLQSEAKPVTEATQATIRDLAVDMLGVEVKIDEIYQLIPARGGKKMTVGLDVSLVLGQLPEERVEGAPRPTPQEMELFVATIRSMEPRIRSRVNSLLHQIPVADYGTVDVYKVIKDNIRDYVNDGLDGLDFGKALRSGIGKRRVTDVLLPTFVRQTY